MISARTSLFSRICVALFVALGFAVVYALAAVWLGQSLKGYFADEPAGAVNENLHVEIDGTVLIRTTDVQGQYRTLDGRPAQPASGNSQIISTIVRARRDRPAARVQDMNQAGWAGCIVPLADNALPPNYWYFVICDDSANGRGYFAGYNAQTRLSVGYFGRQGFTSSAPAPADQFPFDGPRFQYQSTLFGSTYLQPPGWSPAGPAESRTEYMYPPWIVYLHTGGELLKFDLARRTVSKALEADDIVSAGQVLRSDPSSTKAVEDEIHPSVFPRVLQTIVLRRPQRITLFNTVDGSTKDYRLPTELNDQDFTFYPTTDQTALVDVWHGADRTRPNDHDLLWFNADGTMTQREKVTLWAFRPPRSRFDASAPYLAFPVPLFWGCLLPANDPTPAGGWPGVLFIVLTTLCAVILTDRKQRRSGLARSYTWVVFVLLLGFPGFVGFLLHRRWQIHPPAPPPEHTGIEVFA